MSFYIVGIVCILLGIVRVYYLTFQLLKQREEKIKVNSFQSVFYFNKIKEVTRISLRCLYFCVFPLLALEFTFIISGLLYYMVKSSQLMYVNLILSLIVLVVVFVVLVLIAKEKKTDSKDYYVRAFKYYNVKKYEDGLSILQECLDNFELSDKEKWIFLSNKAVFLDSLGNIKEAVNACEEAYPYFISWINSLSKSERKKVIKGNMSEIKNIYDKDGRELLYQNSWGKVE